MKGVQSVNAFSNKGTRNPHLSAFPLWGCSPESTRNLEKEKRANHQIIKDNNFACRFDKRRTRWEPGSKREYEERNKCMHGAEKKMTSAKMTYGSKIPALESDAIDGIISRDNGSRRNSAPHETAVWGATDITVSPRFCSRSINSRWDAKDATPRREEIAFNIASINSTMPNMLLSWRSGDELNISEVVGSTDRLTVFEAMNDDTALCEIAHTAKV